MKKCCCLILLLSGLLCTERVFAQQCGTPAAARPDSVLRPFRLLPPALPADYATRRYGFFCRQELKLDKITPLPVRFRLGSVEETDRMEGKRR